MRFRLEVLPLALVALLLTVATASAQTYTVTRTDDPIPGACEPGDCSLREALTASNNSTGVDDVVVLPAAAPYVTNYEELALPVSDEVEIRGAGAHAVAIEGDAKNGLFFISASRALIEGVTIRNSNGAIQNNADLTLRRVAIEHNEREAAGGGIQTNGRLTIESSYLGFNGTGGNSGGAVQANNPVTIFNSTLVGNFSMANSAVGGNDTVTVASSAFVDNISKGPEGGALGGAPLTVRDSVFARNRNTTGPRNCISFDPIASLGGNVADDASCGAGAGDKPNVDPLLGTLALHGGTTLVYELLSGSPAIDAAAQCPALDQRGVARPQGAACDSGPYELVPGPSAPRADTDVAIRLGKGKLILSRRGFVRVKLTCLPVEASSPCSGLLRLLPPHPKTRLAIKAFRPLAGKRFRIAAGKTKRISLRLRRENADEIRSNPKKRVVGMDVHASDAAGNFKHLLSPRRIVPAPSGPKRG